MMGRCAWTRNEGALLFDTRIKNATQNPYLWQLATHLRSRSRVQYFGWRYALFGRYRLVHVHWPEYLLVYLQLLRRWASRILFVLWIIRCFMDYPFGGEFYYCRADSSRGGAPGGGAKSGQVATRETRRLNWRVHIPE
jgi:hypothetical protein